MPEFTKKIEIREGYIGEYGDNNMQKYL